MFLILYLISHLIMFCQDPNASAMSKMVEPLLNIQQRVKCLLSEWSEHPALQKLLDVTEMLLSVPLEAPLYKV